MKASKQSEGRTQDGTSPLFDQDTARRLFHERSQDASKRPSASPGKPSSRRKFLSAMRRGVGAMFGDV